MLAILETNRGNVLKILCFPRLDIRKSGTAIKDKDGNVVEVHQSESSKTNWHSIQSGNLDIVFMKEFHIW